MGSPPPDAQWYLPTVVTICIDGVWMSGFDFCASRGVQIHVITAWNPGDERPSSEINEARNQELRAEISARGLEALEALGSDPNSPHAEKSWAVVGMTDDTAIELGRKYGQVAVFFITRARQWVLGCLAEWEVGRIAADQGCAVVMTKVQQIRKSGDVMSHQVDWNPESWKTPSLQMFQPQISMFATKCRQENGKHNISRQDVLSLSSSVEDVFIGSMIFGYGPIALGPTRVGRVISENPDLIGKLHRQYVAAANGASRSWMSHADVDRVMYLGPAFATKFAYFAARKQGANGVIPLIADENTSWAMWWLAGIPRSVEQHDSYIEYVNLAHAWGDELPGDYGADEIERAIFKLGQGMNSKRGSRRDYPPTTLAPKA
jgi:hypothetical protein